MSNRDRLRIIFHGALVLLVGLLCGLAAVNEEGGGESARLWHTAHETLITIGVLLLTISSVMPMLVLKKSEATALIWALIATGYGLMVGLILQGITGQHTFSPTTDPVLMIAFVGNTLGMGGSLIAAALTLMGAIAARKAA
jgi:hypothetical protein